MKKSIGRPAFTMIEVIFVVVVLGIVASIGSEVIANVYRNYILQRAVHRASLKTELAAQQLANLISYRIPGTTLARNPNDLNDNLYVTDAANVNDNTHTMLEWIGMDNDGFSAGIPPPWNGFCDVAASSQSSVKTPGSKLTEESTILSNLSGGTVNPAIFFRDNQRRYSYSSTSSATVEYDALRCMGMTDSNTSCISTVSIGSDDETLTFANVGSSNKKLITEHYKLAWTAYAVRPVPRSDGLFDLVLYYNYRPWEGSNLNSGWPSTQSTLIRNVSVFKFAESGNTFRFKICAQENIGEDYNVTICKEKAVIR